MTATGMTQGTTHTVPPAVGHPAPQLLLASQLIFNIGFYSVVPFIAVAMRQDFQLGATAVGLVLGARTFAQQGLFLLGGALSDRWGPRRTMVTGCLLRVAGYLLLAAAADVPLFLLGAVVTGIGGALFSPALESLIASAELRRKPAQGQRTSLFAWLVICGEVGAVTGPLLGSLLLGIGFDITLLSGAIVFTVMAGVFWRFIPRTTPGVALSAAPATVSRPAELEPAKAAPLEQGAKAAPLFACLKDKRFVVFAIFYGTNLVAYNQLYFGLPVEAERSGAGVESLGVLFAYASVLTIALQWPIAKLMRRIGTKAALTSGFTLQAIGFTAIALLATASPGEHPKLLPAVVLVTGLALGHMCVAPTAMAAVLEFAAGRATGAYYGLLSSCGGALVLLANVALGPLYEQAATPSAAAAMPWLVIAVLTATSAAVTRFFLPVKPSELPFARTAQFAS